MIISTWRDPYNAGFSPTKPKEVEFQPGLTVLVGCNGAGKSTLLLNMKEHCKKNNIPYMYYDNLHDGGRNAMESLFHEGSESSIFEAVNLWTASEGEAIKTNFGRKGSTFKEFIENGYVNNREYQFFRAFQGIDDDVIDHIPSKDRVFLFDAIDSGLSVDSVIEVKALFDLIIEDYKNADRNIYLIISANEYELARHSRCFDVNAGEYIEFSDYEEYRNFIISSRKRKEKRYIQQKKWRERQKVKELKDYAKIKALQDKKMAEYNEKYKDTKLPKYDWHLREIEDMTKDFLRRARFISEKDVQ